MNQAEIIESLMIEFNKKVDRLIEMGLNKKGFFFSNRLEIETFLKERCRLVINDNVRIYYVDDIPFLNHNIIADINNFVTVNPKGDLTIKSTLTHFFYE